MLEFRKFWYRIAKWMPIGLAYHVYLLCTAAYTITHPKEAAPEVLAMDVIRWLKDGAPKEVKK